MRISTKSFRSQDLGKHEKVNKPRSVPRQNTTKCGLTMTAEALKVPACERAEAP